MPTYLYRCRECGPFDTSRPLGTAAATEPCPVCAVPAPRLFTAPRLNRAAGPLTRAHEQSLRSADEPDVVTTPPPAAPARTTHDPRHARLPRP
ncbi:putative FmdB family regulatory protein [Halopolyspora algeriensis]|uniref:Putative FmdB family regulatory protein n=1 Tax=Halopolyspora algeriensis TaxID=1500506 RepID=A0A368VTB3_9ACTN|nr:FmdB family zinc ribbon protein [Halopolyspora algeriensis]RCW43226.1 putative FmdB family regulatory protein [Halopolyspora algeriensis]TQM56285.1 putative FmdB family regulatory protein [Halopolyspora algeriensis]